MVKAIQGRQFKTSLGKYFLGDSNDLLSTELGNQLKGHVQLILTSPPFPLNNKKRYGNKQGEEYQKWFANLAKIYSPLLTEDGSIVIEIGNAWEHGRPIQSLLPLQSLLSFVTNPDTNFKLCQQFVCYNPARLPSPAQWVTVNRIRTVDSYTNIWWMSKSDFPKADNLKVLRPYSQSMKALKKTQSYNSAKRPSEFVINDHSFLKDNGGSIAHNLFEMEALDPCRELRLPNVFSVANTASNDYFSRACREKGITIHPARMPMQIADFFIEFLTDQEDLVLDPFAGSNTTGFAAELLGRKWVAIEINKEYVDQAALRFSDPALKSKTFGRQSHGTDKHD